MAIRVGSMCLENEEMKSIHVCELFYRVALDIAGPLPKTKSRNKYILINQSLFKMVRGKGCGQPWC